MLQIQAQFVECVSAVYCRYRRSLVALHHMFCHRCASATRSDFVRHPIRFRPPPVGGYGILPYPRSPPRSPLRDPPCCPHRGCSGLRCTNQATTNQPATNPTNQPPSNQPPTTNHQPNTQPTNHLILPIKSSHISNKNTNFANP